MVTTLAPAGFDILYFFPLTVTVTVFPCFAVTISKPFFKYFVVLDAAPDTLIWSAVKSETIFPFESVITKRFLGAYKEKDDTDTEGRWLTQQLAKELPEKSAEEVKQITNEIISSIQELDQNIKNVKNIKNPVLLQMSMQIRLKCC